MQINLSQKVFYFLFFFLIIFYKNFSYAESRFGELTEMFDDKMRIYLSPSYKYKYWYKQKWSNYPMLKIPSNQL